MCFIHTFYISCNINARHISGRRALTAAKINGIPSVGWNFRDNDGFSCRYNYYDKSQQTYTFIDSEDGGTTAPTFTDGGAYTVRVRLDESDNWEGQVVEVSLKIQSVYVSYTDAEGEKHTDTPMTVDDALAIEGTAENPVTVSLFGNTVLTRDAAVHPYTTLVLRHITEETIDEKYGNPRHWAYDISEIVGKPTYAFNYQDEENGSTKWRYDTTISHNSKNVDNNADFIEYKFTVENGATLNINGAVIVSGILGHMGQGLSGATSGYHSVLINNGSININDNGILDIRGYIKGYGVLTAYEGSTIYAPFIVYDFRGGSSTYGAYKTGKIIPFNTYDMFYNLQCDAIIKYGAVYTSYLDLFASDNHNTATSNLIDKQENSSKQDKSFFKMFSGSEIVLEFTEAEETFNTGSLAVTVYGKNKITFVGKINLGDLSLKVMSLVTVKMSDVILAMSHRFDWTIGNGETESSMDFPYSYKLLPGGTLTVNENAIMTVKKDFIVYTEFTDWNFASIYYPKDLAPAKFTVNGTLIAENNARFGGKITGGTNGAAVITGDGFQNNMTSQEGNGGAGKVFVSEYVKVYEITEYARFDNGVLSKTETNENLTSGKGYKYTQNIREYKWSNEKFSLQPNTTYTYDADSATWTGVPNI